MAFSLKERLGFLLQLQIFLSARFFYKYVRDSDCRRYIVFLSSRIAQIEDTVLLLAFHGIANTSLAIAGLIAILFALYIH